MASQKLVSVAIPTYDMHGVGHVFLRESFDVLARQTFRDFDVVVSDYSKTDRVRTLCEEYRDRLDLHYHQNLDPTGGWAANTNNAIRHATGQLVKILFQDDRLADHRSLETIVRAFNLERDWWLATGCTHTRGGSNYFNPHTPAYSQNIHVGNNTIGSPSVITIRNDHPLLFDVHLKWLADCDYYKRCAEAFGEPTLINDCATVIRIGDHQITNTEATADLRERERRYVLRKHRPGRLKLPNVTVVSVTGLNPAGAIKSLARSMEGIEFYQSLLITHEKPADLPLGITFKQCGPDDLKSQDRKNTDDYSKFMAYRLWKFIESDFALIVHNDAYVLRPEQWTSEFLQYDYVGAPWPPNVHFTSDGENVRVGNGGFSLRSKKLLRALHDLNLPFTDNGTGFFHEDGLICVYHRRALERVGIRFAPVALAARFSLEKNCPESDPRPFGFHNNRRALLAWPRFKSFVKQYLLQ